MKYPKPIMSITELTQLGYSRSMLNQWVHIKGFPAFKTSKKKKAKWLIDTDKLDDWIEKSRL